MKSDSFKRSQSLELQKKFLRGLLQTHPSKFRELSLILKEYSKKGISINSVYERLLGKHLRIGAICAICTGIRG